MLDNHDKPIFLNVDDPQTDPWTWNSADEMFFNISDGVDIKAVRKFLMPFRDLLYVSGVEEIVNPPLPKTTVSTVETQLAALRSGFNAMRHEGRLTDVVFISDDEEHFAAHRSFLAPVSEYFLDLFCGDFNEAGPASAHDPIEIEIDYSGPCVKAILGE